MEITLAELTTVLSFITAGAVAILTLVLPPLVAYAARQFREGSERKQLGAAVRTAVLAAEQLYRRKEITARKAWAIDYITTALARRGVVVPIAEIVAAIEAAVWEELNAKRLTITSAGAAGAAR